MTFNPLRTLVGRMVLVTAIAVIVSGALAFVLIYNDRGASVRQVIETAMTDEIAHSYQRIVASPPEDRAALASTLRGFGIVYELTPAPSVTSRSRSPDARRLLRAISDRLGPNVDLRVSAEATRIPSHLWRSDRNFRLRVGAEIPKEAPHVDRDDPIVTISDVNASIRVDGQWLNLRFWVPGPAAPPLSRSLASLLTVVAVGAGAALVARQVARPLRDLAAAARALGAGQPHVLAPVHGPEDVRGALTAFNAMSERLSRQMSRQRQMLWALSHDLRTPITALRLRAELIEDEATRQRMLAPIAEMENLTEQALSLARAGASEEERVVVDIAEIARTLCGELQDMGVAISAEAPAPVMAQCRPSEVARAMRNLAENAAKYGAGGVMRVTQEDKNVVIEVIDDGPGVPADMLSRLADPFFRAESARSEADGAGLGLAIAQAIADSHGGRLVLENRTPRGFSAKLILPG
jgi:signal transduction histidine kinase